MQHTRRRPFIQEKIYLIAPLLAVLSCFESVVAQQGRPEVIDYYWSQAASAWNENQKAVRTRLVSCDVSAIVKELSRGGVVKSADTSRNRYYFTNGSVDSTSNLSGKKKLTVDLDLSFPAIFDSNYHKTFYPNDTGAGDLAIGFDTDTLIDTRPTGILTIDRNTYSGRRLHIAWPRKEGFRRFGRSYHFAQLESLTVVDTVIESAVIERLLADEDYRLEIVITNYRFRPPVDSANR